VSAQNIKNGVPFFSVWTAIRRTAGIIGIQLSNQIRIFLNDDPHGEI